MAGHLPIGKAGFDLSIKKYFNAEGIESMVEFERRKDIIDGLTIQKLPVDEYRMDEDHQEGEDAYVLYFYDLNRDDYSYEVHLDKDLNVNQVYQVL
jgi:hypothetical protein